MTYTLSTRAKTGAFSTGALDEAEAVAKAMTLMAGGNAVLIQDQDGKEVDLDSLRAAVEAQRSRA